MQQCGQVFRTATMQWMTDQCLAHASCQQAVASILQHRERQGALQHLLQCLLVAPERQRKVARVKVDDSLALLKLRGSREQHAVEVAVDRRTEWKLSAQQGNARVNQPARESVDIAKHRDQTELAQRTQVALLGDGQACAVSADRQLQCDVVSDQGVMSTPAFESYFETVGTDGGARQHAVAAPGQAAGEPAQSLIVEFLHGSAGDAFHLPGADA